jgi:eukaryotic-like serine/threonine-protein kinase
MSHQEFHPPMIGKTLAHYELQDRLGEGGSGIVYRGRDLRLERPVAIKVLADALRNDELAWARLLREARLTSQLNHPHIAAVYDLGEDDDQAYIAMEYVEGLPLSDIITEGGMPVSQVEHYAEQLAGALAFAHEHGIVHGDLKGSNIVVTPSGDIKLLDFGLGRRIPTENTVEVTSSDQILAEGSATAGTLPYLAPEVLRGGSSTVQSDIWSLGVLLYQMATGELPFRGSTPFDLSVEIMVAQPERLEQLPEPLRSIIGRSLEKETSARTSNVGDILSALKQAELNPVPHNLPQPDAADQASTDKTPAAVAPAHRRWMWWACGASAVLGVAIFAAVHLRHARQPAPILAPRPIIAAQTANKPAAIAAGEIKVWVNTDSGTYHCPNTRWYGKTHVGKYMPQKQAQQKGYHPAGKRPCQ